MQPPILIHTPLGSRALDAAGRFVCELPPAIAACSEPEILAHLQAAAPKWAFEVRGGAVKLTINILYEALFVEDLDRGLQSIISAFGGHVVLRLTLPGPQAEWNLVVGLCEELRAAFPQGRQLRLEILGPIDALLDSALESLFRAGVLLRYATGWSPHDHDHWIDFETVGALATFGFRVSVSFYVTKRNISRLTDELFRDTSLANYSAGFGVPLVSSHPYHGFAPADTELPDALDYCRLLARVYQRHYHSDDVLEPLPDLVLRIAEGGCHDRLGISRHVSLLVDGDGMVGHYRICPSLRRNWSSIREIVAATTPDVQQSLVLHLTACELEINQYCVSCKWRSACGGLDAGPPESAPAATELETLCKHRMLFLEHFALNRPAEFCLGMPLA